MIQIRKIREKEFPKKGKDGKVLLNKEGRPVFEKYDSPMDPPLEVESLRDLFSNVENLALKIPENYPRRNSSPVPDYQRHQ